VAKFGRQSRKLRPLRSA